MILQRDAVDLFLQFCEAREGGTEVPPNSNRGPFVEPPLRLVGLGPGYPWCAAEMAKCGRLTLGELWPLPLSGGCMVLAEFAKRHQVLVDTPQRGDLFLLWEKVDGVWRFAHTGALKTQRPDGAWLTSEGNTNGAGSRDGWMHAEKVRFFHPDDRYIRWENLL